MQVARITAAIALLTVGVLAPSEVIATPVPDVPVVFEDEWYEGDKLEELCASQDLHFADPAETQGTLLYAFATPEERDAFMYGTGTESLCTSNSCYFDLVNTGGCSFCQPGTDGDLTNNGFCTGGSWNDRISSVLVGACGVVIWEHTNLGGVSFGMCPFCTYNAMPSGWDNFVSSFWVP